MKYMMIMSGGAIGALGRYLVSGWAHNALGKDFPYGTMAVNLIGCFLIGFLMMVTEERFALSPEQRAFVFVGFLGAFTTFSTFGYETMDLIKHNEWGFAVVNVAVSVLVGLAALYGGTVLARLFFAR